MTLNLKACGSCQFWTFDNANPIDRDHNAIGRKFCELLREHPINHAKSFSKDSIACENHRRRAETDYGHRGKGT